MNFRAVAVVSILLNLILAGVLIFKSKTSSHFSEAKSETTPAPAARKRSSETQIVRLDWRSVESPDYKEYVKNLRAVGCPEETIFDIIVADVNTLYAMKARSLTAAKEWKYWEAESEIPSREEIKNQKLRRELENEKRALLAAILGPDALEKLKKYQLWGDEDLANRKLAFLNEEKRNKLKALQEKFFDAEQAATEWDSAGIVTEETVQKLAALAKQRRAEIESLLSAEELEEFDLRTSDTAARLRQELLGFHPTEKEFRALFKFRQAQEHQLEANHDVRDPAVLDARIETEKRLSENVKSDLGERRFEEFQRSQDIDYQNTLRMTAYFGLPEKAASDVYDLKRRDQAQMEQVNADASLTDEQRGEVFARMQTEAEEQLRKILGDRVFEEYRRNNRWWMRNQ